MVGFLHSCSWRKVPLLSLFRQYQSCYFRQQILVLPCNTTITTTTTGTGSIRNFTTDKPKLGMLLVRSANLQRYCHSSGGNKFETPAAAATNSPPPFESNILRLLAAHIHHRSLYHPPHRHVTEYNGFTVEDRPGEQWITLRGKSTEDEHIKIEATMFDGSVCSPPSAAECSGEDVRLHISLLVDIWKGDGNELLEFVCSAWPDSLEIQKVYIFRRDNSPMGPYMGPNVRGLKLALVSGLYEFLRTRGVNDDLSLFLHEYMMNKDKGELINWLGKVKKFFET
ncbi:unnamed protein product [Coffea canephora]|uniref:Mitochondrial glycoprotein n=1 Tax=Coffea canephora TaxID=49390 RepID=A0A068VGI0_COFCA|nr:unnamed protein product [Coffea canephora]